jgi:hypothetical protein
MNASAFPSRRRHIRIAPSFRPEQAAPRNSNAARTVIPTGADRLFSSAFASCERVGLRSGGISLRLRTWPPFHVTPSLSCSP